jgi:hypothetical protein
MAEPHVTLDPEGLSPVEEKLREPLEEQLTSALQVAVERIGERYAGESVDEVYLWLVEETRRGLHPDIAAGFHPERAGLREVAATIVRRANPPAERIDGTGPANEPGPAGATPGGAVPALGVTRP